jgi:polyphosphate glucokinase
MDLLVVDIGGSSVKLWHAAYEEHRKFSSGKGLTPEMMIRRSKEIISDWRYDLVALGLPCRVSHGRPVEDPQNLGRGWTDFDFASGFERPVRIMNDAALQALGSYEGGRMLFLGLGTGVGSALIAEHLVLSLDLGRMFHRDEHVFESLGDQGLEELGSRKWRQAVREIVVALKHAMLADYVVVGGGNIKELSELPDGVRRGHNRTVVEGGRRLWEQLPDPAHSTSTDWIID